MNADPLPTSGLTLDGSTSESWLQELAAGLQKDLAGPTTPIQIRGDSADSFIVALGGRPAVIGLSVPRQVKVSPASLDVDNEVAIRLLRRLPLLCPEPDARWSTTHYLADLGHRPDEWSPPDPRDHHEFLTQVEESLDQRLAQPIVIDAPIRALRSVEGEWDDLVPRLRQAIYRTTGLRLPNFHLSPSASASQELVITLGDVRVRLRLPNGAGWRQVVHELEKVVSGRPHWFVSPADVGQSFDDLSDLLPDLAAACLDCYDIPTVTATLRELVRGGRNVQNLSRIAWLLLDLGATESGPDSLLMAESPLLAVRGSRYSAVRVRHDPVALASRLRKCIAEEAWRIGVDELTGTFGRLAEHTEVALQSPESADVTDAEWEAVGQYFEMDSPAIIVVRTIDAIAPVRAVLDAVPSPPRVIASSELPPDVDLAEIRRGSTSNDLRNRIES